MHSISRVSMCIAILTGSMMVSACGITKAYVIANDKLPDRPSVVVIPASNSEQQIAYANDIEQSLINSGLRLKTRPRLIEVSTVASDVKTVAGSSDITKQIEGASASVGGRFMESYFAYSDVDADLILRSDYRERSVRIFEKDSSQLLAQVRPLAVGSDRLRKFPTILDYYLNAIGVRIPGKNLKKPAPVDIISLHDIPDSPSFSVIPQDAHAQTFQVAQQLEAALITNGYTVFQRPDLRAVLDVEGKEVSKAELSSNVATAEAGESRKEERYFQYRDSPAGYFVMVYGNFRQVRIINREDEEIVSVFDISNEMETEKRILRNIKELK